LSEISIGLVQINNSFSGQNYLPYSVACLQGYAETHAKDPARFKFLLPIYKRTPIREAVAQLSDADIVGFSTYVWNAEISFEIARRLKANNPEVLIVFGGPQVPDMPEEFLRTNSFIDIAIHNEGERYFLELLEQFPNRDWGHILSASYIKPDGSFQRNDSGQRMKNLGELPSPFLNGMFDNLLKACPDETWIGLWETNRGCPFQCTFCDWGSATAAKLNKFEEDRLLQEMDWFADNKIEFIFCCDANFGILPRDVDIANYAAKVKKEKGYPTALSVQNTKNATDRAYLTQKILSDAGLNKGVTLSMQSVDETTLKNIKRENISLDTYLELQRRFTKDQVETYSDLILGLPGETYQSFIAGVNTLIETGQHNRIQFNNLSILPNAEMGDPVYLKKYGMETVTSEIINIHGSREELDDDVAELQELVIATASMPRDQWRKTRAFCWMTAFLHFDKILQMPLIVLHELADIPYDQIIEAFMDVDANSSPLLADIRDFFLAEAKSIQDGGTEYVYSEDWLGIYWPADEYTFIRLTADAKMAGFFEEARTLLHKLAAEQNAESATEALDDAVNLNQALVSQPFLQDVLHVENNFNIIDFWTGIRTGEAQPMKKMSTSIEIDRAAAHYDDFNKWCQEVVWWGNKKGAYLYSQIHQSERQIAGIY
jgi:radical SAM superfamily enzyme YgiQ (UPF0313 family)